MHNSNSSDASHKTKSKSVKTVKSTRAPGLSQLQNDVSIQKTLHNGTMHKPQLGHGFHQYTIRGGDGYYPAHGADGHLGLPSPGMMASPLSTADQCSPEVLHSKAVPFLQGCELSKLPQPMSNLLPTYTSASNNLYAADPASPMQIAYSHDTRYNGFPEGASTTSIQHSHLVPPHPPPNYTEATTLHSHLPPNYDSIMMGHEYPPHLTVTLPNSNPSLP